MSKLTNLLFFAVFLLHSCARVQTLNTVSHTYSKSPTNIIWFQIAGFSDEHLPLLSYKSQNNFRTWFEDVDCLGKAFNYNLFSVRPRHDLSFLSAMFGSMNIKGNCSDYNRHFFWNQKINSDAKLIILENGVNLSQSILNYRNCTNEFAKSDFENAIIFSMNNKTSEKDKSFHFQEILNSQSKNRSPDVYYDLSCQKEHCLSGIFNNIKAITKEELQDDKDHVLIIRDFEYLKYLEGHNILSAKNHLTEIDSTLKWLKQNFEKNTLILVSGSSPILFDFPKEGKEWEAFEKSGKNFEYKNLGLMSPVFASGPTSENFCGIYNESAISERINFKMPKKIFSWDVLNPFGN
jgi:hypothetical protein